MYLEPDFFSYWFNLLLFHFSSLPPLTVFNETIMQFIFFYKIILHNHNFKWNYVKSLVCFKANFTRTIIIIHVAKIWYFCLNSKGVVTLKISVFPLDHFVCYLTSHFLVSYLWIHSPIFLVFFLITSGAFFRLVFICSKTEVNAEFYCWP